MNQDTRRTRLVLATLLVTSFVLITLDVRGGESSPLRGVRSGAASVFGPVQRVTSAIVSPVSGAISSIGEFGDQKQQIKKLQAENDVLRRELKTSELDRNRAAELDKLLRVAGLGQYKVVAAQVIGIGSMQGFSWTVTIDAGSRDGVKRDQTVVNGDGLVGRITTVGSTTSTVLLANDPTASVGARLAGSLEIGIVTGHGSSPLTLQLLNAQATMRKGDRLVTFGSQGGRPFVAGVPIGEVEQVKQTPGALTRSATVVPYVDFTALDLVGIVVVPPRTDPRDAVLPRRPAAASGAAGAGGATGRRPAGSATGSTAGPSPSSTPTDGR